jgi:hypothetical protein
MLSMKGFGDVELDVDGNSQIQFEKPIDIVRLVV